MLFLWGSLYWIPIVHCSGWLFERDHRIEYIGGLKCNEFSCFEWVIHGVVASIAGGLIGGGLNNWRGSWTHSTTDTTYGKPYQYNG